MKYLVLGLLTLLSVLPKEQLLGTATGCSKRYLRRINGKCYYFSVKKLNWFGALNNCLRKGLTLADLSNPGDFYGAIDFLNSKGNTEDFWFGGNDLQHEGRFQYISNGRLVKYFSNYSIVEPAEHSECDDCLEARIRSNLTVVADDDCLERQYFICTERYCNADLVSGKPRHHSHEHLHHFHHDIGDDDDGDDFDQEAPSPSASASKENAGSNSEADVAGVDVPDLSPEIVPDTDKPEKLDKETTGTGSSNDRTTASPTGEGGETSPTEEGEETTPTGTAEEVPPPTAEGEGASTTGEGEGASTTGEGEETAPTTTGDDETTLSSPEGPTDEADPSTTTRAAGDTSASPSPEEGDITTDKGTPPPVE